jgi:hypothetical protein
MMPWYPRGSRPLSAEAMRDLIDGQRRACMDEPALFFPPDPVEHEPKAARDARVAEARVICEDCPVRLACLARALRVGPESGVWAGFDADAGELDYLLTAARRPVAPAPHGEMAA